jgi:hypothetical protein
MSMALMIWLLAAVAYAIFWYWYVGFGHRIKPEEIEGYMHRVGTGAFAEDQLPRLRHFLETDTGREFVMVNNLQLTKYDGRGESPSALLQKYQKPFLGAVLRRGGHPLFVGRAVADNLEQWGVGDDCRQWSAAGLIRYRSRRDMLECVLLPQFQDNHPFKQQALQKTFAYPTEVMLVASSPRWMVALALVTIAALAQLALC